MLFPFYHSRYNRLVVLFRSLLLSYSFIAFFTIFSIDSFKDILSQLGVHFIVVKTELLSKIFTNIKFPYLVDSFTLVIFSNDLQPFIELIKLCENNSIALYAISINQHFININFTSFNMFLNVITKFYNIYEVLYVYSSKIFRNFIILFFFFLIYMLLMRKELNN